MKDRILMGAVFFFAFIDLKQKISE